MLSGRVALVTGGSGGIGAALCRAMAGEGATVAVGYRDRSELAERIVTSIVDDGGRAAAFPADLLVPRASELLVDAVESALGPVDVLIANHGHAHRASFDEVDVGAWDETLAINLRAPFLLAQRVIPGMKERGFGRILFMSSVAGFTGGIVGPHYAASKAGLHGLTHFLASRVAEAGITVNALAPALIEHTDMPPATPATSSARSRSAASASPPRSPTWPSPCCATPTSRRRWCPWTAGCTRAERVRDARRERPALLDDPVVRPRCADRGLDRAEGVAHAAPTMRSASSA